MSCQMNETVIVFLSDKKENLTELESALSTSANHSLKKYGFKVKSEFLEFIQNSTYEKKVQILILDINNSDTETLDFISKVNNSSPNTLKLIFSDSETLLQVQNYFEKKDSLYYLNRSWSKTDYRLALNTANAYSNLQIVLNHKSQVSGFSRKLEDQLSAQLKDLNESNTAKDKFFSIIAHDLKSPFTALLGISEILISDWNEISDKEKLDLVKGLRTSTESTYKLLENLLIWSKTQLQKLQVEPEEVKIFDLLDFAIETYKSNAEQKQIQISNKVEKDITGFLDKNMIATVFRNLLSNAISYTQPGGLIYISSKVNSDFNEFCISDNGKGITDQSVIDHFKMNSLNKTNGSLGRMEGLGLLMCKDFVERNGGKIWLETKKGEGSKFFFTVPRS